MDAKFADLCAALVVSSRSSYACPCGFIGSTALRKASLSAADWFVKAVYLRERHGTFPQ